MTSETTTYLPAGLPAPRPAIDGLDAPFWEATQRHELVAQRCPKCEKFQWGPEWLCFRCHSFELEWTPVPTRGRIFSWERVWHPVHPALREACPYLVVLVELPGADNIRMVGNLLGDPLQQVQIDGEVEAVFEDHADDECTLVQWRAV